MIRRLFSAGALLVALTLIGCAGASNGSDVTASPKQPDRFVTVGKMTTPRIWHTATPLPDGNVLVTGGWNGERELDTIELYNAKEQKFSVVAHLPMPLMQSAAVLLTDGNVLVTGGSTTGWMTNQACIVDTRSWRVVEIDPMASVRTAHTMVMMSDGNVLVTGGEYDKYAASEVFNQYSRNFAMVGGTQYYRRYHSAVALDDVQVFITGGTGDADRAEVFSAWNRSYGTPPAVINNQAGQQAVRLKDGRVLLSGMLDHMQVFDPTTGQATDLPKMSVPRLNHTATALNDGRVLLVGSWAPNFTSAEVYDLKTGSDDKAQPSHFRQMHTATKLADGSVLVLGGTSEDSSFPQTITDLAELFIPRK